MRISESKPTSTNPWSKDCHSPIPPCALYAACAAAYAWTGVMPCCDLARKSTSHAAVSAGVSLGGRVESISTTAMGRMVEKCGQASACCVRTKSAISSRRRSCRIFNAERAAAAAAGTRSLCESRYRSSHRPSCRSGLKCGCVLTRRRSFSTASRWMTSSSRTDCLPCGRGRCRGTAAVAGATSRATLRESPPPGMAAATSSRQLPLCRGACLLGWQADTKPMRKQTAASSQSCVSSISTICSTSCTAASHGDKLGSSAHSGLLSLGSPSADGWRSASDMSSCWSRRRCQHGAAQVPSWVKIKTRRLFAELPADSRQ